MQVNNSRNKTIDNDVLKSKDLLIDNIELDLGDLDHIDKIDIDSNTKNPISHQDEQDLFNYEENYQQAMNSLNMEFDAYLYELNKKLQIVKEERKKTELNAKLLQHRVYLLHNQEKLAASRFESTKKKIEQIIENRKFINFGNLLQADVEMTKRKNLENLKNSLKAKKREALCEGRDNTSRSPNGKFQKSKNVSKLDKIRIESKVL
jgi:hypothetical protein